MIIVKFGELASPAFRSSNQRTQMFKGKSKIRKDFERIQFCHS